VRAEAVIYSQHLSSHRRLIRSQILGIVIPQMKGDLPNEPYPDAPE
jgi:hypothetical protein